MQSLSAAERGALDLIQYEPMLAQVQRWASVNSGTGNLAGLAGVASMLADAFAALPGKIELVDSAPVERILSDGTISQMQHGQHLVLTVRPEAPLQLLFTGHMDTVFAKDHSFQNLAWLEDGVLNGPGVADMKGGISVMLHALLAVEDTADAEKFGYQVLINSDEEVGSPSSAALITKLATEKLAALTYEPAASPDGTLAGARAGSGNFSVIFCGKSAHAGRNPDDGRNALLAAADLALRMKVLTREGLSVNPARIEGGSPNNVVPDHAILRVNLRPRSPELERFASDEIARLIALIEAKHGVSIDLHGGFGRPPKPISNSAAALFGLVKICGEDLGLSIGWEDSGGVCDGNNIAACGVPVVDTMGVRGGSIHSSDEFLITGSLVERAQLSALTILRLIDKGSL